MRKHEFDITAFVWGLLFLVIAGAVALNESRGLELELQWLLPAGLITLGIGGIASAIRHSRR